MATIADKLSKSVADQDLQGTLRHLENIAQDAGHKGSVNFVVKGGIDSGNAYHNYVEITTEDTGINDKPLVITWQRGIRTTCRVAPNLKTPFSPDLLPRLANIGNWEELASHSRGRIVAIDTSDTDDVTTRFARESIFFHKR